MVPWKRPASILIWVDFKSTFLGQGLRLLDRTANGTSLFLGVTDKALENKPDEQK